MRRTPPACESADLRTDSGSDAHLVIARQIGGETRNPPSTLDNEEARAKETRAQETGRQGMRPMPRIH